MHRLLEAVRGLGGEEAAGTPISFFLKRQMHAFLLYRVSVIVLCSIKDLVFTFLVLSKLSREMDTKSHLKGYFSGHSKASRPLHCHTSDVCILLLDYALNLDKAQQRARREFLLLLLT